MRNSQHELKQIAENCANKIEHANEHGSYFEGPFQHIILDSFLPESVAKSVLDAFPDLDDPTWEKTNDAGLEIKARTNWASEFDVPEGIVGAIRILNSAMVLKAMSKALSIPKLMPDPYFTGGGLNVTEKNGLLDVHIDGNYHDASGMNRRVNILIYFNPEWEESWGGQFGIYDTSGSNLVKAVEPIFNRCVIFDTHDKSFHGLPNPINFPANKPRRSILLYYYTVAPRNPEQIVEASPHSALWKSKGMLDKRGNKRRSHD